MRRAFLALIVLMLLPGLAAAVPVAETIRFSVEKIWVDSNLNPIDSDHEIVVEIVCNTGLPLTQEATISAGPGNGVEFVVLEMTQIEGLKCTINEKRGLSRAGLMLRSEIIEWSVSNGQYPDDIVLGGCLFDTTNFLIRNYCTLVNMVVRNR
jgi:hypothetical protein